MTARQGASAGVGLAHPAHAGGPRRRARVAAPPAVLSGEAAAAAGAGAARRAPRAPRRAGRARAPAGRVLRPRRARARPPSSGSGRSRRPSRSPGCSWTRRTPTPSCSSATSRRALDAVADVDPSVRTRFRSRCPPCASACCRCWARRSPRRRRSCSCSTTLTCSAAQASGTSSPFLLRGLPGQAQLAIGSRADPALPLARMRAAGEVAEFRAPLSCWMGPRWRSCCACTAARRMRRRPPRCWPPPRDGPPACSSPVWPGPGGPRRSGSARSAAAVARSPST